MTVTYSIFRADTGQYVKTITAPSKADIDLNTGADEVSREGEHPAESYLDGEEVKPLPPRPGEWAVWGGSEWIDPRTPADLAAELEAHRQGATARIASLRGQARLAYITDLPGQDMLYIAKAEEAAAYLSDPAPADADYPLVMSEVGITAPTAYEVAQVFANLNALWKYAAGSLDAACFQAEAAVQQAPDIATIDAILTGLAAGLPT